MTVQAATRMWSVHDATITVEKGRKYKAVIREGYQILCDATDGLRDVANAPDLPALNQLYPGSFQIRVVNRQPRQVTPIFWICEITYEGSFGPTGVTDSPLNERPDIRWGKITTDEPVDEDRHGNPLVNANGEPVEGVTKKISDMIVYITRNYAHVDTFATEDYLESVNSDAFLGRPAGTGRLVQFDAEEVFDESIGGYYRVSAAVQFRRPYRTTPARAWWARVRHEGYKVRRDPSEEPVRATDDDGQDETKPVALNADGTRNYSSTGHWLEFELYEPLPYYSLGLV